MSIKRDAGINLGKRVRVFIKNHPGVRVPYDGFQPPGQKAVSAGAEDIDNLTLNRRQGTGFSVLFLSQRPYEANVPPEPKIGTVVYMRSPFGGRVDIMREHARQSNLSHHYCVVGTTICLFSNKTMDQLGSVSPLLSETSP